MIKKVLSILICLLLTASLFCGCGNNKADKEFMTILAANLGKEAGNIMYVGEDACDYVYRYEDDVEAQTAIASSFGDFPERFDLRDYDLIPSVKNQGYNGTCWSFSVLGASETSILNELGMTKTDYINQYGIELDFSEVYFVGISGRAYNDGDDLEGMIYYDETVNNVYNAGGNVMMAVSTLANHIGMIDEESYPYSDDASTLSFMFKTLKNHNDYPSLYVLQHADNLISPVSVDDQGNYVYNELGTLSIKKALTEGKAVAIAFHFPSEDDELVTVSSANDSTASIYVNQMVTANHGVIIVGYDDNYSKDNFNEDCRPEKDGAWIFKNSWGLNAGDNGYYYISYYDQTLCCPECFDYYVGAEEPSEDVNVYAYDYMNATCMGSTLFEKEVAASSVYTIGSSEKLFSLGTYTDNLNTEVNYKVYKLNDKYQNPSDGELIYETTVAYTYGGYHTADIDKDLSLSEGDVVGIVVTQKITQGDKTYYALVSRFAMNKKNVDGLKDGSIQCLIDFVPDRYCQANVDAGENFVYYNEKWMDWSNIISQLEKYNKNCGYMAYDNIGIKLFTY